MVIIAVGVVALLLDAALLGTLVRTDVVDRESTLLANQATDLANCCGHGSEVVLLVQPYLLPQAIPAALAGTPQRHAVVVDAAGTVLYASPMPASLEEVLLARARRDLLGPGRPPRWTHIDGQLIAEARAVGSVDDGPRRTVGMILLAENGKVASGQWERLLVLVFLAGALALALIVLGAAVAARAVARPMRAITVAARGIAAGDYSRRATPSGSSETQELAGAFNTMIDEVLHQRQVERDLLANVSHELAAPLGLIRGYAEALADNMYEDEAQRLAALRAIGAETAQLARLSGDLLDLALLETGQVAVHLEPVPVGDLLAGLRDRFGPLACQSGVTLSLDVPPALPVTQTDGLRLEQALVNVLTNALRHTPAGGSVTLSGRVAGDHLRVAVADTGPGIPPADLARIWERFYQVDKGRDRRTGEAGVGLGLAIARSTMALLGGGIDADSAPGAGTTFTLWLPIH
jgi:signal transduction histidine kinase